MYLPPEMIAPVLGAWIEAHLLPQTKGAEKFAAALAAVALARRGEALAREYAQPLRLLGITDDSGRVDLDAAGTLAREALEKCGNEVRALGFVFGPDDVQSLAALAEKHAKP